MNKIYLGIGTLAMAMGAIFCCSSERFPGTGGARGATATVELDLFSGRPNPTWTLSEPEVRTLLTMLDSLPSTSAHEQPIGLGYRGFVVRLSTHTGKTVVKVHKGIVRRDTGATVVYLQDPEGQFEKWLLQTGKPTLEPQAYESLRKELTSNEKQ